jgi:hypothetical protein
MFRNLAAHLHSNRTFFALTSTKPGDSSVTSMLTSDQGSPLYLCGLHAPHRMMLRPEVQQTIRACGETAVRVWLMTVSNPGLLYATNPSTIATFLDRIVLEWDSIRRLAANADKLSSVFKRVRSKRAGERLRRIAASVEPLAIRDLFPGLRAFLCWDGGYVKPFIDRIRERLPEKEYIHLPMYSMSTETVETIDVESHFLPIAPGVLYEFIEPGKVSLLRPHELRVGHLYTMIVSDRYGLRRYDTEDLFECAGFIRGVPDLRFARRSNLSFSFTGEKLTGPQLQAAFEEASARFPEVSEEFLTCFPSLDPVPCYRIVRVRQSTMPVPEDDIAAFVEERLCAFNHEFKSKIESGRLGHMRFESIDIQAFVTNESQFKFLPLYPQLWEMRTSFPVRARS